MQTRFFRRLAALLLAGTLCFVQPVRSAAADGETMAFRMLAERTFVSTADLADGDLVIGGALYIDNYTGISDMKLRLKTDAPLVIENGGFTRDPSRKDSDGGAKQCYFEAHGTAIYTGVNDEGELKNIALWYGPGDCNEPGVVENPDSSFLTFQVRIPKGTPAGVYRGYISEGQEINIVGQTVFDFSCYNGPVPAEVRLIPFTITVADEPLTGDMDGDGTRTVADAVALLKFLTEVEMPEAFTAEAADVNGDGMVTMQDAQQLLSMLNAG